MQHPVPLDHLVRTVQQVLRVDRPEVALARTEHDGDDVHSHLVDQPCGEQLTTDIAGGDLDHTVTGELLAAASIALIPLLVIFIVLQRHFINGILAGSVKG